MSVHDLRKSTRGYKATGPKARPWMARGPRQEDGRAGPTACFHTKAEAEAQDAAWVTAKRRGEGLDIDKGRATFEEYATEWLAAQVHRKNTAPVIESRLRTHVYPIIGPLPIAKVRATHIRAMVKEASGKLAPSTVSELYNNTRAVFNAAVDDRVIPHSPCPKKGKGIQLPKQDRDTKVRPLTYEEVIAIAEAMPARWYAMVTVAAGTGLRPSEVTGLTVDRVDFLRRTLKVDRQMLTPAKPNDEGDDKGTNPRFGPLKTAASYATLPLAESVVHELAEHLRKFPATNADGLVFTTEDGGRITDNMRTKTWRRVANRVGLPNAVMHDLRHFYASALIASGASVVTVQHLLRHATATETLTTYAHLWPGGEEGACAAIDAIFGGGGSPTAASGALPGPS